MPYIGYQGRMSDIYGLTDSLLVRRWVRGIGDYPQVEISKAHTSQYIRKVPNAWLFSSPGERRHLNH